MWPLVETGVWVVPGKKRGTSASLCNSNGDSIFASVNPNFIMFRGVMMWSEVVVTQSCPTLCNTMNFGPPGSSVYGILQGRTLEWVAIPFARGSSQPWNRTWVSCIVDRFFTVWATRKQGKQCQTLFLGAPKSLQMLTAAMKLKDAYSLEGKLWPT